MKIHHVKIEDWERLRNIRLRALKSDPDAFGSTFEREKDQDKTFWQERIQSASTIIADLDGQDVGILTVASHWEDNEAVGIFGVWVAPVARGNGVGNAIMEEALVLAKTQGALRIRLEVGDENAAAIALYARWEFEPSGHTSTLRPPREHITEHERVHRFDNQ